MDFNLIPDNYTGNNFTFLYGLAQMYNIDCTDDRVPWEPCRGCGLGGCPNF